MQHSSHELEQSGSAIYSVIQSLIDSQQALVEIGEKLEDQNLKRFFLAESLKRAEFRGELESVLNREGVSNLRRSMAKPGSVQHALADLRIKSRDAGEHILLATAEQGEDEAREAYSNAINAHLPVSVRQLLASQASHIAESHEFVKTALEHSTPTGSPQAA
jgi:uncharacterized protein (TIGR02284 family)